MENWTPEHLQEQIESGATVFLKLWKKGCGACKLSIPAIERIVAADTHQTRFGQISTDDHPEILEITDTEVLPAFFVFKDKSMVGQVIGFKGIKSLQELIDKALPQQ